jgi:uncharacterized protein (DUF58 family)
MMIEIAATIAFSAIQNNDKIGVLFFTDKIEKFIPPKKGKKHILYIIRELIGFEPEGTGTDLKLALEYATNVIKRRCTAFLISDFIAAPSYNDAMLIANRRHDVVALQVYDKRETELPNVGLMKMRDVERGTEEWIDTSSARVRKAYAEWWQKRQSLALDICRRNGVDVTSVATDEDYVVALMNLFKKRG